MPSGAQRAAGLRVYANLASQLLANGSPDKPDKKDPHHAQSR